MLEVVRQLLESHERGAELLAIFGKLVARNSELELRLSELLARQRKGEGISTAQLLLFLFEDVVEEMHRDGPALLTHGAAKTGGLDALLLAMAALALLVTTALHRTHSVTPTDFWSS